MIDGPAYSDAAEPVITNMPAPIMAPIPSVTKFTGPRARLRLCSPVSSASFISVVIDFVANKGLAIQLLLWRVCTRLPLHRYNAKLDLHIVGAQHAAPLQENFKI